MGAGEGRGGGRYTGKKCRLVSMFSLTVVFFLVEIIVGKPRLLMVMVRLPQALLAKMNLSENYEYEMSCSILLSGA